MPTVELASGTWADPDRANRRALRLGRIGRRLQVAGLLAAAFVGFVVVGTEWQAARSQSELRHELAATHSTRLPATGHALARIQAPAAGIDAVVVEGAGRDQLTRGPGHVRGTANPGGHGKVVIVGPRVAWDGPFRHLGDLQRGDRITVSAPWGRARYTVTRSTTMAASSVDLSRGHRAQLTLVTSSGGSGTRRRVVIARLASHVLRRAPAPVRTFPELPGSDVLAFPLALVWAGAAVLAWRSRRWLTERWGRLGGVALITPLVVFAIYESFAAALHVLPATF